MLHLLGLSKTAETVYLSMLRHPKHRVAGLAAETGLREADLRAALDELGQLALLRPSDDVAGGVRPVSPSVGLASLLASMEADVAMRQAQVETARAAIAVIAADHQMEQSGEGAVVLQGIDAVRARLEELQRSAQFECLSLNPGAPIDRTPGLQRRLSTRRHCVEVLLSEQYAGIASATTAAHSPMCTGSRIMVGGCVPYRSCRCRWS